MKVQHSNYPPIDIPEGAWPVYKAQGYTKVLDPQTIAPEIEVRWSTQRGRFIGDYECPPLVIYSATNGTRGCVESTVGTAHKTAKVFIPGQKPATCPEHVGREYEKLFAEWAAKSKKKNSPQPIERFSGSTAPAKKGESWGGVINAGAPWSHQ